MAPRTSRFLAPAALLVWGATAVLFGSTLSGCVLERETTLSRAARQREVQALRANRERLGREREILIHQAGELGHETAVARQHSVRAAAQLRATRTALQAELDRLVVAEQDLAAAKARGAEIERELQPLRDLEKTLREHDKRRAAAEQRVTALQQELAAAEAKAKDVTAKLQPRLDALRAQIALAEKVGKAVAAAQKALEDGAKVLATPEPKK